jgi:hypothetical protein
VPNFIDIGKILTKNYFIYDKELIKRIMEEVKDEKLEGGTVEACG